MSEDEPVNRKRPNSDDSNDDAIKRSATKDAVNLALFVDDDTQILDASIQQTISSPVAPSSPSNTMPSDSNLMVESTDGSIIQIVDNREHARKTSSDVGMVDTVAEEVKESEIPANMAQGQLVDTNDELNLNENSAAEAIDSIKPIASVTEAAENDSLIPSLLEAIVDQANPISSSTAIACTLSETVDERTQGTANELQNQQTTGPLFQLRFRDDETLAELKSVIEQAIRSAMLQLKRTVTIERDGLEILVTESTAIDANEECVFIVDAMPTAESHTGEALAAVPTYRLTVRNVFNNDQSEPVVAAIQEQRPSRNSCWNCNGEHSLRDCTEPRNFNKVRQNRGKFSSGKTERYHVDATQRFGAIVPGELSSDLRKALGLHRHELPLHIYRMRTLGYPPGWLEHAKVSQSGLALFDANGMAISEDAANDKPKEDQVKYDLRKIISFPGFNVKPNGDVKENKHFPPMLEFQSKDTMLQALQHNSVQSHRVTKLKHIPIEVTTITDPSLELTSAEMDIDDDFEDGELMPPLPAENPINLAPPLPPPGENPINLAPPPPPPPPVDENTTDTQRSESPSLIDLHEEQQRLLAALDESLVSSIANTTVADDSLIDDILALDDTQTSCATSMVDTDLDTSNVSNDDSRPYTPTGIGTKRPLALQAIVEMPPNDEDIIPAIQMNSSKQLVFGTPLIESASPFSTLPTGSSWSVGVSDIMDFENLPESTGKYKKMKGVIIKVRHAVKQLNDEYD